MSEETPTLPEPAEDAEKLPEAPEAPPVMIDLFVRTTVPFVRENHGHYAAISEDPVSRCINVMLKNVEQPLVRKTLIELSKAGLLVHNLEDDELLAIPAHKVETTLIRKGDDK